ncbi:MAG: NAD(P)-dependent glycerol-1-phosphate dehydrogenase [Candidatus Ranarchaeia archaeon]|jgi:glycerol-1-phosphate dehydrogenase [NAD(P)+]
MVLPREVIVGDNTLEQIGEICKRLGLYKSALVVMGPKTQEIAGKKVMDLLNNLYFNVDHFVASSSTLWDAVAVGERIEKLKPQIVLAVGGGTKIDVAKLSSARKGVSFISIPTSASHDGIASPLCSLKGSNRPFSVLAQAPMAIVADTKIIVRSPHRFTASGCGDILSKLTAVRDWKLAHDMRNDYYGEYAASLSLMSAKLIMKNASKIKPGSEEGLRILLEALISVGVAMSIAGSSRPGSGSEHLVSHALDLIVPHPALHGAQCGVGVIMMACLHNLDWRQIRDTLREVGAPTTADELGVESKHIIEALVRSCSIRPNRYTILNEQVLDHDSAGKLAKSTGVID